MSPFCLRKYLCNLASLNCRGYWSETWGQIDVMSSQLKWSPMITPWARFRRKWQMRVYILEKNLSKCRGMFHVLVNFPWSVVLWNRDWSGAQWEHSARWKIINFVITPSMKYPKGAHKTDEKRNVLAMPGRYIDNHKVAITMQQSQMWWELVGLKR